MREELKKNRPHIVEVYTVADSNTVGHLTASGTVQVPPEEPYQFANYAAAVRAANRYDQGHPEHGTEVISVKSAS